MKNLKMVKPLNNKLTRHEVRIKTVQTVFQLIAPLEEITTEDALDFALFAGNDPEEGYAGNVDAYLRELVEGVLAQQATLDQQISQYLTDWTISTIAKIDLTILRIAFYEILFVDNARVPNTVAVNEAIELSKAFSDDKSRNFISGVLAKVLENQA